MSISFLFFKKVKIQILYKQDQNIMHREFNQDLVLLVIKSMLCAVKYG
uniref:Uncharacterized protein n=1 Tax=Arundo donax TaxID=35708 RepID=A0A0A9BTI7_ARUDO